MSVNLSNTRLKAIHDIYKSKLKTLEYILVLKAYRQMMLTM